MLKNKMPYATSRSGCQGYTQLSPCGLGSNSHPSDIAPGWGAIRVVPGISGEGCELPAHKVIM